MKTYLVNLLLAIICSTNFGQAQAPLPAIVPPITVTVSGVPAPGHLFATIADMTSPSSNWPSTVLLMDELGELVFYMPFASNSSAPYIRKGIGDFKIHVDGRMSFTDALFGNDSSIYIMDSTFQIVDTLRCTPEYKLAGHDFQITADGHYHILAVEERIMDASALTTEGGQPGDTNCVVVGHIIQEFDENKNLIGEWKTLDHFLLTDSYEYYFTDPSAFRHAHVNAVFIDFEGNYIISSRTLNEITRIDRLTGQILWRLGGKNNQFTFLGDTLQFTSQHDAQYFADGTVVLYDNATNSNPDFVSRMLVYAMDTIAMTVDPIVNFQNPLNLPSGFMGSARSLDLDHKLISWGGGYNYALGTAIQEFDAGSTEILAVDFENGFVPYRAVKLAIPWSINRPKLVCDGGLSTLSTLEPHNSYLWSTGETTPSITISSPGTYQVWTDAGAGFLSSIPYEILDLANFCDSINALVEFENLTLFIYPNPASDVLTIECPTCFKGLYEVELSDLQGREVYSKSIELTTVKLTVNIENLSSGIYQLRVTGLQTGESSTKRISISH